MTASQSGLDDDTVEFFVNGEAFSFTDENPDKDSSYAFTKISSETPKFDGRTDPVAATTFTNNVVDNPELTIDIRDHHVVPADVPGNEQGTAPIILFKFTATNKTNEPLMPLLPSDFHALQSKQLADAPFPTKTPSAHLSTRSPWAKASKNAMAFVLEDTTRPVELIVHDRHYAKKLSWATYPVS